jgi:tRNA U34 2-thiouridine synthase MnmA/TrmU|tara:strand:+ start:25147 stop:25554 length:408 start_codon:yes stop_codon:yes gene_type:complete
LAEISRNLGNSPALVDQRSRRQQRIPRGNENSLENRSVPAKVIDQKDDLSLQRYQIARLEAEQLSKYLFEMKVQDSIVHEKAANKILSPEVDIDEIKSKVTNTASERLNRQIEELMSFENDMPIRNEPLFVNIMV